MSVVVPMERDPHAAVQSLLPWYARGQLDDAEMNEVRNHVQGCERCQAELAAEQSLLALLRLAEPAQASDAEAGLARMRARLAAAGPRAPAPRVERTPRWMPWGLGLQGAAIAALLAVLVWPQSEPVPAYRALATPGTARSADAVIIFSPAATEQQMRQALQAGDARLVGGPTATGAYLLQLGGDDHAGAVQRLRSQPGVSGVESLEANPR